MDYEAYHDLRALVVDDFDSFRQTLSNMLESFGVPVIEAAVSGSEVLRRCADHQYDLILCDYNLGRGKNGQQILEELRHRNMLPQHTLFILISAESSRSIIMSAYDYEPDAYLAKPITGKSLKQRLDRLLTQRDEMLPIYQAMKEARYPDACDMLREKIIAGTRLSSLCQKLLGELYLTIGDLDEAERVYRQALEIRTLDWARVGMAKVKRAQGNNEEATQWLDDILKKNPLCMQAYDVLADIHREQNDSEALERVLKQAVDYSPLAILRQEKLAQMAHAMHDNALAAQAYRATVKLGANSCHNKRENHINFGRTTAALLKEDPEAAVEFARDAVKALEDISNVFEQSDEEIVQGMLVESQVHARQGNKRKAAEVVERAQKRMSKLDTVEQVETQLDLVEALQAGNRGEEANALLKDLVSRYENNQSALEKIDHFLEEPVSEANRKKVAALNKEGIQHYESGNYKDAVACFTRARRVFPHHVGIHLNLVQALEAEMREYGASEDSIQFANSMLSRVAKQIDPAHVQHERYMQLKGMLTALGRG